MPAELFGPMRSDGKSLPFAGQDGVGAGIDDSVFTMTGVRADRSGIAHFDLRWPGDRSVVFEDDVKVKQCVRNIFGRENAAAVFRPIRRSYRRRN